MYRGGIRHSFGRGRHRNHGQGARNEEDQKRRGGGSRHPSGLSGKEIGLWYARQGKEKKKRREFQQRAVVTMTKQREEKINSLLGQLRDNDTVDDNSQHTNRSWRSHERKTRGFLSPSWYDDEQQAQSSRAQEHTYSQQTRKFPEYEKKEHSEMNCPFGRQKNKNFVVAAAAASKLWSDEEGNSIIAEDINHALDGPDVKCEADFDSSTSEMQTCDQSSDPLSGFTTFKTASDSDEPSQMKRDVVLDQKLLNDLMSQNKKTRVDKLQEFRKTLPSYKMKKEILELVNNNQVVVISGETGCGKTTQVTQFILDDAIERGNGSICRIVCTQPRRISAISVAERVAAERGEKCGNSVGYQIRLEGKPPRSQGSILYCTTGVMLRWLLSDPLLNRTSHIVLDEIHERDLLSDFLIIIIRDLLPLRSDLKLILMSATLNADFFSAYFGNCPAINIPGFTYPVKEMYLEEVIEMTRYSLNTQSIQYNRRDIYGKPGRRKSLAKDRRLNKGMAWLMEDEEDHSFNEELQWKRHIDVIRSRFSSSTVGTLENMNYDKIDFDLVVKVITHISLNMEDGAILCFLPGWDDITKLFDSLKNNRLFSSEKFLIIPLHSMLPTSNQQQVFERPPPGTRKIVIATNIAETSITIDDVVFVVDCGKVKEKTYDASNKIACLQPVWISKASSKQRRGRAGRVQPGYCFHLFTEFRYNQMNDYQLPEMLRTPLEELCLQIKILKLGQINQLLSKALQPPSPEAIANAVEVLTLLKALDNNEELTPLGYHLANLPVDPRIGKMILFGAIFSCLDPVLTVSSSLGFKEPFVCPLHRQKQADEAKARFAGNSRSDHLTLLKAFEGWEKAKRHGNESDYCWKNFLSSSTLKMISNMKEQFTHLLCDIGFLDNLNPKAQQANLYSGNTKLVKAILCAGLYPNVAKIDHHLKLKRPPKLFTQEDGKVALHPKSVNSEMTVFQDNWLIYHRKLKSSKVYIHDSTMIAPYPLLFFGGKISVFQEEGHDMVAVDEFIKFKSPTRIATLVKELRSALDKLLQEKIAQPEMKLCVVRSTADIKSQLLHAIIDLITTEESASK